MLDVTLQKRLFVCGLLAFIAVLSPVTQAAEQSAGWPDFGSGVAAWDGIGPGDFQPIAGGPVPVTQDPNHIRVANADGGQANYRLADTTNPNLLPWARAVMERDNEEVLAGKIAFTARSHCQFGGTPNFLLMGGGVMHILQSPDQVVMIHDGDAQIRYIPLNVAHAPNPKLSWYGDSVGHYEGDTLVVDTIGMNAKTFVDAYRTPHTDKLHAVERLRLLDGGEKLEIHVTVDDPGTFVQPWQGTRIYSREAISLEEMRCAENNEHVFDYDIPSATGFDF